MPPYAWPSGSAHGADDAGGRRRSCRLDVSTRRARQSCQDAAVSHRPAELRRRLARLRRAVQHQRHAHDLENELRRVIHECGINHVLDVGAHHGQFGGMLRDLGYRDRIDSFEPSDPAFSVLTTRSSSSWGVHKLAIGLEDGSATLHHFAGDGQLNSLKSASAFGSDYWEMSRVGSSEVPVKRLETLVGELAVRPERTLLKLDTQGLDFDLVRSAPGLMDDLAAVLIELPMFGLYDGAERPGSILDWLRERGLNLIGLFPVHGHPRPIVPVEFDALFARSEHVG